MYTFSLRVCSIRPFVTDISLVVGRPTLADSLSSGLAEIHISLPQFTLGYSPVNAIGKLH